MSNLLDLTAVSVILDDLNRELRYKAGEDSLVPEDTRYIYLKTAGDDHQIVFLGQVIYSSATEKLEDIPLDLELRLNEREAFERHLRILMNDQLNVLKKIEL